MLDMRCGRAVPAMLIVDIICLRAPLVSPLEFANSAPGATGRSFYIDCNKYQIVPK